MTTWGDIKVSTLQKMFASTSPTLIADNTTTPFINSMPQVANEALQILSTSNKFLIKSHDITQDGTGTGKVQKYDFKTLVSDFYSFKSAYLDDENEYKVTDLVTEGKGIVVLPTDAIGTWTIYYNAYPQQITKDTPDNTELSLDPEVVILLPMYMASELGMEDDPSLATMWRNKFEVAREAIQPNAGSSIVQFTGVMW